VPQPGEGDHVGIGGSLPATCFPTASAIASSWNPPLLRSVGEALAQEARACNLSVILGPGVNMKRSPLCGRNFEYFSEDPYLAGALAVGIVDGIQSNGVGTSVKHYAANNQETDRLRVDAQVDERTPAGDLPASLRAGRHGSPAVDDHVFLQQGQRGVRVRAPLVAHPGASGGMGLRRAGRVGLGCRL
jgi:sensor domain CHASE-containing protein